MVYIIQRAYIPAFHRIGHILGVHHIIVILHEDARQQLVIIPAFK